MSNKDSPLLSSEEIDWISNRVTTTFREAIKEQERETERIKPWTTKIWKEMFGDMKPHDLASGMAMSMAVRKEFYRREEAGEL